MSTEKIKSFLKQKKTLMVSGIALFLIVSTIFTFSFVFTDNTKAVALVINGDKGVYQTAALTVQGFLDEQNIEVKPSDKVSVDLNSFIEDDQTIEINSAVDMTIIDNGQTYHVKAHPATVDEVLAATGHARGANDWVYPQYKTEAKAGSVITVYRITYKQFERTEARDINVVKKYDSTMPAGTQRVEQEGICGVDNVLYEYMFKDGKKICEFELERITVQEAQDKIIVIGTKQTAGNTAEASPVSTGDYSKCLTVSATAYTHTGNRTATGTVARVGVIAVDPKVIPLGTRVYVEGYGYATAEDTGGAIKGNRIDVFLNSNSECINWGRRNVKIYILD